MYIIVFQLLYGLRCVYHWKSVAIHHCIHAPLYPFFSPFTLFPSGKHKAVLYIYGYVCLYVYLPYTSEIMWGLSLSGLFHLIPSRSIHVDVNGSRGSFISSIWLHSTLRVLGSISQALMTRMHYIFKTEKKAGRWVCGIHLLKWANVLQVWKKRPVVADGEGPTEFSISKVIPVPGSSFGTSILLSLLLTQPLNLSFHLHLLLDLFSRLNFIAFLFKKF